MASIQKRFSRTTWWQRVQFAVSRRSLVFSDHTEYRGARGALVGDEIAKPLQHARIVAL
jgi:hypothetical protein